MNSFLSTDSTVLMADATPEQLGQAIAQNHTELFCTNAMACGGEVYTKNGITCTHTGAYFGSHIAFPALTSSDAGSRLDETMLWFQAHSPAGIRCWSLNPPQPADLGILLLARGFQADWQPNWMVLNLNKMKENHAAPAGLQVVPDNITPTHGLKDLPYSGNSGAIMHEAMLAYPDKIQRCLAMLDGKIVGHSAVFLTTGTHGVAGLFNVSVMPDVRRQGIGKAVVLAVCRYAREKGYHYAILNGTGRRMYEQVGFRHVGSGYTWLLRENVYFNNPPSAKQVLLAEAAGRGDVAGLDRMHKQFTKQELHAPLSNGMSLIGLAAHCRQYAVAEWLAAHGIPYSALDAWDLGWKDRAATLLATNPQEVNRRYGHMQQTLLHTAAERNDIRLAQLALSAKPDLEIKDTMYHSTPLGWAQHLRREQIEKLITSHIP